MDVSKFQNIRGFVIGNVDKTKQLHCKMVPPHPRVVNPWIGESTIALMS